MTLRHSFTEGEELVSDDPEAKEKPTAKATAYNRVALLRMGEGISRAGMARELGISAETLAYIERAQREPGVILAWRISKYFGLPLDLVFSDSPVLSLKQLLRAYYLGEYRSGEAHSGEDHFPGLSHRERGDE